MLGVIFYICYWHLSYLVFSDLSGSVFWLSDINLRKFSIIIVSSISSVPFSLFPPSGISIMGISHHNFCSCLTVHGYSLLFFFFFFTPVFILFAFWVLKFLLIHCQALSSALSSLLVSPSKASFIPVSVWGFLFCYSISLAFLFDSS